MKTPALVASLALAAGLACTAPAQAQTTQYQLFDIGQLSTGDLMYATGINNSGQVSGYAYTNGFNGWSSVGDYRGFVSGANGTGLTGVGTFGGTWSKANGINDAGQVVGEAQTAGGSYHAFLRSSTGSMQDLGTLGATNSSARAINASGQVIGLTGNAVPGYPDAIDAQQGFITDANGQAIRGLGSLNGQALFGNGLNDAGRVVGHIGFSELNQAGTFVTGANGSAPVALPAAVHYQESSINNNGQIAGTYIGPQADVGRNAYIGNDSGTVKPLDFSAIDNYAQGNLGGSGQYGPASFSETTGINEFGQVAGVIHNNRFGRDYAFITGANGQGVIDVNSLFTLADGDWFRSVTGINDHGQFVVNSGRGHVYLISPIPEPATLALWGAGLLLIGGAARRRLSAASGSAGRPTATARTLRAARPMPC
jgi:probable HAF family extracellular repeat protein